MKHDLKESAEVYIEVEIFLDTSFLPQTVTNTVVLQRHKPLLVEKAVSAIPVGLKM